MIAQVYIIFFLSYMSIVIYHRIIVSNLSILLNDDHGMNLSDFIDKLIKLHDI